MYEMAKIDECGFCNFHDIRHCGENIINTGATTVIYTPCTWICPQLITNSSPSLVGIVYLFQAWNVVFAEMTFASDRMANEKMIVIDYRSNLTGNGQ